MTPARCALPDMILVSVIIGTHKSRRKGEMLKAESRNKEMGIAILVFKFPNVDTSAQWSVLG